MFESRKSFGIENVLQITEMIQEQIKYCTVRNKCNLLMKKGLDLTFSFA